ncbi:MAG: protein phosphatase 2C domain-containing protein [Pirellulales bacterium]
MYEAKNTQRALVRIGYDGRVYKIFRGPNAKERFENEVRILRHLEARKCNFVPRVLETKEDELQLVTTNCGARVDQMSPSRIESLFAELETFGVRHDDPFLRNITYRASDGRFCIIDFEFATLLDESILHGDADQKQQTNTLPLPHALKWSGMTHPGRFRPNKEDSGLAILLDRRGVRYLGKTGEASLDTSDFIFAVSDGMGGERSGEFASKIAIEKITLLLPKQFHLPLDLFHNNSADIMNELFHSIHHEMTELSRYDANCRNMGATLSLGWFKGGRMYFAHIGDSRIYLLRKAGGIQQLTEDHTHVGWLRRNGKINEREARMHPRKNVLAQALGAGHRYLIPNLGMVEYEPGDRFVFCTDGVIDGLWDRGIDEQVRFPNSDMVSQSPANRLVLTAVSESGRDNATAVVVEAQ